tara:strand:+ start:89 stop:724 length:636 start_codon:yes stop_codon:yes gene_type:complete
MIVGKDKITKEMLQDWQQYWEENKNNFHMLGGYIAKRIMIEDGKALEHVKTIIGHHFNNFKLQFAGHQRQYDAHLLHMDEPGTDRKHMTYTLLVPLSHDKRIKTVIFNEPANTNKEIQNRIMEYGKTISPLPVKSNVGETELAHTSKHWQHGQYFADTLELKGIFEYNVGDYVIFDTNLIHSSNNWKNIDDWKDKHKEIIQAHFKDADTLI